MAKILRPPSTALFPVPTVLVTCIDGGGKPNIITLAWVGTVCSDPPQVGISINPVRYSHRLVSDSKEFVVNIPSASIASAVDYCGMVSGRDVDKFAKTGLTAVPGQKVATPLIEECPVNIECSVRQIFPLGSHDLFVGEVVAVNVDQAILKEDGSIDIAKADPFAYNQREYWTLKEKIGFYGFSIKK